MRTALIKGNAGQDGACPCELPLEDGYEVTLEALAAERGEVDIARLAR